MRHLLHLYRSCNRTTINHLRRAFSFSCFLPRKSHRQRLWLFLGRGRRIRTRDPRFWRPVLYQLSYTPVQRQYYSTHTAKKQGVSRKIKKLFCVQIAQQDPEAGDRQRKVFRKIRAAYPVQTKIRTLVNRQKSGFCTGGESAKMVEPESKEEDDFARSICCSSLKVCSLLTLRCSGLSLKL